MTKTVLAATLAALTLGCTPQPSPEAGESANLTKAKALVEASAKDFETAAAAVPPAGSNPDEARAVGARLRQAFEARRSEGEALQKLLTEDEKRKLQEFGLKRLVPAVAKLEAKLGTDKPAAAPAPTAPAAPLAEPASPAAAR
ncbi:MAG: hypothetical protein HY902_04140 [Deltaproteobacteria bacterium]|nr:hypothetical protein [Deltaproteobacteria bacterium]